MAGRAVGETGAQANNPPPTTLHNVNSATPTPTETPAEKKKRRAAERARRKENKKRNQNEVLIACSQNYNGSSSRDKMEETSRQMQRQKIGIAFGQEGRRPRDTFERWDTCRRTIYWLRGEATKQDPMR